MKSRRCRGVVVSAAIALCGMASADAIVIHDNLQRPGYAWQNAWGSSSGGDSLFGGYHDYAVVDKVGVPPGINAITGITTSSISSAFLLFGVQPILPSVATVYVLSDSGAGPGSGIIVLDAEVTAVIASTDGYGLPMCYMTWSGNIPVTGGQDYYIGLRAFSVAGEPNDWYYVHDAPLPGDAHQSAFGAPFGSLGQVASSMQVSAVPAPASLALVGLGGLVAARRRR